MVFLLTFIEFFWDDLKFLVLEMFNGLHRGDLNLRRLNFGMISLIPKLKDANNIRQFRPICVLNVDYKWFIKALTLRLTRLADKLISKNQTTFIPGRFILEGVIILHEILHELRVSKTKGVILKLDFERRMIRSIGVSCLRFLNRKNSLPCGLIGSKIV
jgi:hypothetical protein